VPIHTHTALPVQYTVYPACISYREGGVSPCMSGRSASRHRIAYAAHPYRYDGVAAVAVSAEANTGTPPCKTPMCLCTHTYRATVSGTHESQSFSRIPCPSNIFLPCARWFRMGVSLPVRSLTRLQRRSLPSADPYSSATGVPTICGVCVQPPSL